MRWPTFIYGSIALALFFYLPHPAAAAVSGDLGIVPANSNSAIENSSAWFIYTLNPGESKDDQVKLINNSEQPIMVKLYAVDAVTTEDGSFSPLQEYDERIGVGNWITLDQSSAVLAPQSSTLVSFRVAVPANASVGDHAGALIMVPQGVTESVPGQTAFTITQRIGARVFVTIPGEAVRRALLQDFSYRVASGADGWELHWSAVVRNTGTVKLEPVVQTRVTNLWGRETAASTANLGWLLPESSVIINPAAAMSLVMPGRYTLTVRITDGKKLLAEDSVRFWQGGASLLTAVIVIGLVLLFFSWLRLHSIITKTSSKKRLDRR